MKLAIFLIALLSAFRSLAAPSLPHSPGIESEDYQWNSREGEKIEALGKQGDKSKGQRAYRVCGVCHLPSGAGRPDGSFPQLAGQHATVLIKQMADIRAGLRDNPAMFPFARTLTDPQELADVAAYIESLCIPREHGLYGGADAAVQIAKGRELYERDCQECHGRNGEGNREKFYPVIAGQHYRYLLRQMIQIRDGERRNANPAMVRIIKELNGDDLVAISAYQASLEMPGSMCAPRPNRRMPASPPPAPGPMAPN